MLQEYDVLVGDITITSNRSNYVDFTLPFTELGSITLVKNDDKISWIFLKPFSTGLWITTVAFFIFTGFIVWIIERPINEEFQGSLSHQLGMIFWFSFSTLVFAHSMFSFLHIKQGTHALMKILSLILPHNSISWNLFSIPIV